MLSIPMVEFRNRAWSIIAWTDSGVMLFGLVSLTGVFGPLLVVRCHDLSRSQKTKLVYDHWFMWYHDLDGSVDPDGVAGSMIGRAHACEKHRPPPHIHTVSGEYLSHDKVIHPRSTGAGMDRDGGSGGNEGGGNATVTASMRAWVDVILSVWIWVRHPYEGVKGGDMSW
ncbi:hypothetical protein Tco_1067408 [Tanacetum coccineum]|uniref:Uncharacterized protein n=1 Tax=Tanacetum coccineum TaxID=301880 RepID=A0ABQ5HE58_9ASTR